MLVTLGLSSQYEDVSASLDDLVAQVDDSVPLLLTIGPAGLFEPSVTEAIADWAAEHDDRVALVDLRGMAPDASTAEQWARAFAGELAESGTSAP